MVIFKATLAHHRQLPLIPRLPKRAFQIRIYCIRRVYTLNLRLDLVRRITELLHDYFLIAAFFVFEQRLFHRQLFVF